VRVAEATEALLREADDVRGQAAHYQEQHDLETAAAFLQIEYGLRLVAHVFAAVHEEDEEA
jgi:hypothetical protein